ncbi:MAG: M16 family metallopeptidase, partial [Limisphaerales bacterium]
MAEQRQTITRLNNGLAVISAEIPHAASVSIGIWVAVGSRHESAVQNGAAHFIEHMLFKGTRNRDARQIVGDVEGLGGYLNAYTSEDHTCYYARARADKWRTLLDVLWDMFDGSTFPAGELRREREVIKEERAMYLDDPHYFGQEILGLAQWPDHPLGRPIEGTEESLDGLQRRGLMKFKADNYHANNTFIVAAGNLSHAQLVREARSRTQSFCPGELPPFLAAPGPEKTPRIAVRRKDIDQTQIALAIRTCGREDKRRSAVRLLNALMAENMSSRLYQVLRERHGLAYSVNSSPSSFADTGDITITAGVDSDRFHRVLELLQRELKKFRSRAPTQSEVKQARDYVLGQFDIYLESNENYMTWLGESVIGSGEVTEPRAVKRRLSRVTPEEIHAAAKDFLQPGNFTLAVVTPRAGEKKL